MAMQSQVLIVDDSRLARMMTRRAVETVVPDAEIIEAVDAKDALAKAEGLEFTAALLDLNMPGADGFELARALRDRDAGLPIAICSANIQDCSRKRAQELAVVFIEKPVDAEKLRSHLEAGR